ncbi:metalloprotease PmbA [Catenovulum sp. 2E275]|uniref:metalloprotease PmbA n=1 Tax=Catenovulum sp. 2E275 TaxID=2980497 RepID=UPI0021D0F08C|nr:metalloprotease PmbA [Catenovulum sp. 2E275]MCU4675451.1 metalloprotease PmbA [Catenovulum sp. 2E275]
MLEEMNQVRQAVEDALALAKKLGASDAEVSMSKQQGLSVGCRLQEVETVEFDYGGALGIAVWFGKRKGSASTSDLSPEALKKTVEAACNIAKYTSEDPFTGIADPSLMVKDIPDLDLYHPSNINSDKAIEIALACEKAGLEQDSRIENSDGASFSSHQGFKVYGNSTGLIAAYPSSRHSLSCALIARDGDDMQRDYAYTVSRVFGHLESAQWVGQKAANEVLSRLNPRKAKTCKVPVLFNSEIASSLFGHFIAGISGGNLYRKASFLLDALNTQVFPKWLTIEEDPFIKQGLSSRAFDSEGVATQQRKIVENGVLNTWLLTSYAARKMGLASTGHAGGIHNWLVGAGGGDFDAMLKKLGTGLLVTEMMGQGVNIVTGDYSRGAAGFWVENGEIQYPVSEITIAAKLTDMLKNIVAIGDDIDPKGSIQCGSVLVEEMQIAGN